MTPQEWAPQWARLSHLHVSGDTDRDKLSVEWFAQLKHHHVDAVDHGITQLIGQARDNFLPGLGLLKDFIRQRFDRYERTSGKCPRCGGSGWVEAPPYKVGGVVYSNVVSRCGECGIPAPQVDHSYSRREKLTDIEAHEYQAGRYGREQMPAGLEGKPWDEAKKAAHKAQMRAAFDALRKKLFGHSEEVA